MRFSSILWLLLGIGLVLAQDDAPTDDANAVDAPADDAAAGTDGEEKEECEEAWDYVEFLKKNVKEKIETILQETLFKPRTILEETVTDTVEKVLEIRDDLLARTKAIRTGDESITICEDQNIKQEEFLTQVRTDIMSVLLALIEKDAANQDNLKNVGRQLLNIRSKVNNEVTRMIMLRSSNISVRRGPASDCDCGILGEVVDDLDKVIEANDKDDDEDEEAQDADFAESQKKAIEDLTGTLMKVDAEIKALYNEILVQTDEESRQKLSDELLDLKQLSGDLHKAISKLAELDPEFSQDEINKTIKRDVRSVRNDADSQLKNCQANCPTACDSCGSEKIADLKAKLEDYEVTLEEVEEPDSLESIRSDLMNYLSSASTEMTDLLKKKAADGELDECDTQKLEVINKVKGPLWMLVNTTIFGDKTLAQQMTNVLDESLDSISAEYCGSNEVVIKSTEPNEAMCDEKEIETSREWIMDIDLIISDNLFKSGPDADEDKKNAMIGLINLKSSMDERVKQLFQKRLECRDEAKQIKNVYVDKVMECLGQLMNPRLRFEELDRSKKVECVKQLRVTMEDRRGELLMREIEKKIKDLEEGLEFPQSA